MKMASGRRALDKIFKRRDRYDIPDWQRGAVWDPSRKQQLIDSILRGWKLPKFYFLKVDVESYEVVDGQQRLNAIYEFFRNELALPSESAAEFGGIYYRDLTAKDSDSFDDFEIEYDEIEDATEEELKQFFQRLQQGLPLTSSEKLNSVQSNLRDFCRQIVQHQFFQKSIAVADTRFAYFDIAAKVAAIEVEGIGCGLRYEDIKNVFEAQASFSSTSAVANRIKSACDFLALAFPTQEALLKNRTVVQSVVTLACRVVETRRATGHEASFASFVRDFLTNLGHQVELGGEATDPDYTEFEKSINANIKAGARIRNEVLLRKALLHDPAIAAVFDAGTLVASGIAGRVNTLGEQIANHVQRINSAYSATHGEDLFKATNKTAQALLRIGKPIGGLQDYTDMMSDLYFLFRESSGSRLAPWPQSFVDVNALRTDLQHDVDHGQPREVRSKRILIGTTFEKYSGVKSPQLLDGGHFVLVQARLLSAIESDLASLAIP